MQLGLIRRRFAMAMRVRTEAGARGVVLFALARIASRVVHLEWLAVYERRAAPRDRDPDPAVRWAGPGDIASLAALGRGIAVVEARLARGDRVAGLFEGDRIVAYAWYRSRSEPNPALRFEIEPGAVWGYDLLVEPERRGRRFAARVLDWAEVALADEGARRIVSTIDACNVPAFRVAARRRAIRIGTVLVARAAGRTLRREAWAGRRPRWSLDRGAGVVPVPCADGTRPLARGLRGRPAAPRPPLPAGGHGSGAPR